MSTGSQKAMRLPPLKVLRVRDPRQKIENPCQIIMISVLSCWASTGYNSAGCAAIENQLRACMDGPKQNPPAPSTINYHLGRMQKYVTDQPKKGSQPKRK